MLRAHYFLHNQRCSVTTEEINMQRGIYMYLYRNHYTQVWQT